MPIDFKVLAQVLDAVGKGWRFTLPGALAAGTILYVPDSMLPFAAKARVDFGAWLLVAFVFCSVHFVVFAVVGGATWGGKAGRKLLNEWNEGKRLTRLSPRERIVLALALQGEGFVYVPTEDPAVRSLLRSGLLESRGVIDDNGHVGVRIKHSAHERLKQYPGLLDVSESELRTEKPHSHDQG